MDLSALPKQPSYPLYRYLEEAFRIVIVTRALLAHIEPYFGNGQEKITDSEALTINRMNEELVFQRLIDNFQTYVVDLIAEIFASQPQMIPKGEIDRRQIFKSDSLDNLRLQVAEDVVRGYGFKSIVELHRQFSRDHGFDLFSDLETAKRVGDLVHIRNLLVHHRGLLDYRFRSRFSSGDRVRGTQVDIPSARPTLQFLTDLAGAIDHSAQSKYGLERVESSNA